ncbi:sigma 54-interacting transcriptional regulator [Pseudomaricurvus alkylphenolicus]|uniref:sigma-54-dependent Fis family transcriptional regulator n=1 Tax=Pseudomaricurvus alkylphenolicus TaxID=1306991 RepID=UPI00141E3E36|nr:sigma-54-dependent Fis family transcriptional regulator [Pseudomaricurvus alkylphenolicus]NIB42324.1 sigma 54-interacting transcriptional regulator [Pseudomaricurvus alkylphenolicus]
MPKSKSSATDSTIPEALSLLSSTSINLQEIPERLHFNTEEGLIWLEDRRMVMMNMEVLGALRQELIEGLGIDAARGLLTRFGYAAGCKDAELAMKLYKDQASINELMMTGPKFHALQGIAVVDLIDGEVDAAKGVCSVEFIWRNCFEASIHSQAYGIGESPACWTEAGYSSGFLSTCMGKRILVREVECCAQGFDACRCIAKPVEDWGDVEEELSYFNPVSFSPTLAAKSTLPGEAKSKQSHNQDKAPARTEQKSQIIGASTAFNVLMHKLKRVAPTSATVLLLGESGVGKSALAKEACRLSRRADKPFLELNCAAIPETLIESELFGAEKGAYTGATSNREGRFQAADGGTLFLDEIGTLSMIAQGKLLRVIQTGEFEPLGSSQTHTVDVRIIAATNEDLMKRVKEGTFREDLFYRLNVFPIVVPPLRQRREDIPVLLEYIINKYSSRHDKRLSGVGARALQVILNYSWPGNIRELENVIERGIILADDDRPLSSHHLFTIDGAIDKGSLMSLNEVGDLAESAQNIAGTDTSDELLIEKETLSVWSEGIIERENLSLEEVENALFLAAFKQADGNLSKAADKLGVTRSQFSYRVKKMGLTSTA